MADHRYETSMYYTDISMAHGLNITNPSSYSMVPAASSHQHSSRQSVVASGPPTAQYDASHNEPVAKKRRVDDKSSAAPYVSQKKWTYPESQQWTGLQAAPTTKSKSTTINNLAASSGTSTKVQQLPTPQTPRFPHHNVPRLNRSGEERIVKTHQSDDTLSAPLMSGRQYSASGQPQALPSPGFNLAFDPEPQSHARTAKSPRQALSQSQNRPNYPRTHATQSTPFDARSSSNTQQMFDQPRIVSPRVDNKPKASSQTLSLEKDADQIQALIAAKLLENESNSFVKRLQQKQVSYRNSKSQNSLTTSTDSSGLPSPQMSFVSSDVAEITSDQFSAVSRYPPQPSSEVSRKSGSQHITRPATPSQSSAYASQFLVQPLQSTKQDSTSVQLRSELMKASASVSSSNLSSSPSPRASSKFRHTPELEQLNHNSTRRTSAAIAELQAPPVSEIRTPRSTLRRQEQHPVRRSSVQHPVSAISTIMDSNTSALRRGISSDSYKHTPTTDWEWPKSASSYVTQTPVCTDPEPKTMHSINFDHFPSPAHGAADINGAFQAAHHLNATKARTYPQHSQVTHDLPQTMMAPPLTSPLTNSSYPSMQQGLYYTTSATQNNPMERPTSGRLDTLAQTAIGLPTAAATASGHMQPQPQPQLQTRLQTQTQTQAPSHVLNSSTGMHTNGGGYSDYPANLRKHGVC